MPPLYSSSNKLLDNELTFPCGFSRLRWVAAPVALSLALACASAPEGDTRTESSASRSGQATSRAAAGAPEASVSTTARDSSQASRTSSAASARAFPGFTPETFDTEPLALLPPARISLPPELSGGPEGEELGRELEGYLLDRLPEEVRVLHARAPVYGFREWSGPEEAGPRSGFLRSVLDWQGDPGPAGELPEIVGNSVEEVGDSRGIRFFLFPRSLTVLQHDAFHYVATVEAFLLDARGERVVWAGTGQAAGSLPEGDPDQILLGIVRDAAVGALADLAARLPGGEPTGGERGFSDGQR